LLSNSAADAQKTPPKDSPNIFVARQPIFTRNQEVIAYELLFRSGFQQAYDAQFDGERATSRVITGSFFVLGIDKVTQGKKAFINFSEDLLLAQYPLLCEKKRIVIEVLEDVKATVATVDACRKFVELGYTLALDDFVYSPSLDPLLSLAKIVKFDILQLDRVQLEEQLQRVKPFGLRLLAEKVESQEELTFAEDLGFHYFQGYFFSRPKIVSGRDIPSSKIHLLRLLRMLHDSSCDFGQLGQIFGQDIALSYKLLKFVNSALFSLPNKIESLNHAIAMLGEQNLRQWLSLIFLADLAEDKPSELLKTAIIRAQFCERVGLLHPGLRGSRDALHTIGMFSLLDAMLDRPLPEILAELSLSDTINNALLGRTGDMQGMPLQLLIAYEKGDWQTVAALSAQLGLDQNPLPGIYQQAIEQAEQFTALF